jgi:hypothetical protein
MGMAYYYQVSLEKKEVQTVSDFLVNKKKEK